MIDQPFDPFRDRLSRDIRNDLSESLMVCLREQQLQPAQAVASRYLSAVPGLARTRYITDRLRRYALFLAQVPQGPEEVLRLGLLLWELELYFEVHEILEHAWRQAAGEEKKFLQAMIRAAGVFIKGEFGFTGAAASLGAKALPILQANWQRLAIYTDPDAFIEAIRSASQGVSSDQRLPYTPISSSRAPNSSS